MFDHPEVAKIPTSQRALRDRCFHPSGARSTFTREEIEGSIVDRFESMVDIYADRLAVRTENRAITYSALNAAANRLAREIRELDPTQQGPIPLLLDLSPPAIIAILGILKAGRPYAALDPTLPQVRLAYALGDLQASLIVTSNQYLPPASSLAGNGCQLIDTDETRPHLSGQNLGLEIPPDTLAGIFYTSGTTGKPKGVVRDHRAMLHRTWYDTHSYHICAEDRLSLLYSPGNGTSASDILGTLLNGATLYPYDFRKEGLVPLAEWLVREEITLFHPPIALLRQLLDGLTGEHRFPKLRLILMGSEALYERDVENLRRYFPPELIRVHRMGASETGRIAEFFMDQQTKISGSVVPVGYAAADKEILIVNEAGTAAGYDQAGEIAVKSRYLARGYWRLPELTQKSFVPDPQGGRDRIYYTGDLGRMRADDCLELLGRSDFQVKIRGYRVELLEIEAALHSLEAVSQAAVVALKDDDGEQCLVAYVVPSVGALADPSVLRRGLSEVLPEYMIPSSFMLLEKLPLTPTGKVDRQALPDPDWAPYKPEQPPEAPRTALEEMVASIFSNVLNLEMVGIHDDFFELGGHSLLAIKVIAHLGDILLTDIALPTIFESPTVAKLSRAVTNREASPGQFEEVAQLWLEITKMSTDEVTRSLPNT